MILHDMYYIWCHPYCVYDYTSSISDMKPVKTAISSTLFVITPSLSKTFPLMCKTSHVAYVCHHMHYTWHHIHTLWLQPTTIYDITCTIFITSHALYMTSHLLCVMTHLLWVLRHTMTLSVTSNTLCLWHIPLYRIMQSVMTSQPLYAFTATMTDILFSVF